jgi:hypothetical protein
MSGGGGDQEVNQKTEPFAQQLPYVQNVFSLADARRRQQTPGAFPQAFDSLNSGPAGTGLQVNNRGNFYYNGVDGTPIPTTGPNSGFYNNIIPGRPQSGGAIRGAQTQFGNVGPAGSIGTPNVGTPQFIGGVAGNAPQQGPQNSFQQSAEAYGLPTLQYFPGQTVAGQTQDTRIGQGLARGAAGNVALNNEQGTAALQRLLRGPNVNNDPTLNAFADAATRPLYAQQDSALSENDDRAIAQGAFGGSRQALSRQDIRDSTTRQVGDVRAGIYNNAYNQQFAGQQNAIAQLGAVNSQQTQPAQIFSQIGAQNEEFNQQNINAARERFEFERDAPDLALNQYANLINQFSGPTASTQTQSAAGLGTGQALVGGALTGLGARSLFSGG